ncbi:b(0,+)-type amino acid transporter 1-like [Amblyomma americanum]
MGRRDDSAPGRLRRDMGLFSATAVVVSNCAGAGIFITPTIIYMDAGSLAADLLVWIGAGVASLIHGLCIAELGTMLPSAGGPYEYVSVGFESMGRTGDILSFLFAWSFLLADPTIVALHGLTFSRYALGAVYDTCTPPHEVTVLVAVIVIALSAVVNTFSLKTSMKIQNVLLVVKLGLLLAIVSTGIVWCVRTPTLLNKVSFKGHTTPGRVVEAFAVAIFAMAGSFMIACMAEEMSSPSRILPRSLLGGLLLMTALLVLTNFAYFVVLDHDAAISSEATAMTFGRVAWGAAGTFVAPVIVCCCSFAALSATFLSNSRLFMAAARRKHLPAVFSLITVHSSLPVLAIVTRLFLAVLFTVTGSVGLLAKAATTMYCFLTLLETFAMIRLRLTMKDAERPFRAPVFVIVLNCVIFLTIFLAPILGTGEVVHYIMAFGCILLGFPAYVALKAFQQSKALVPAQKFLQKLFLSVPCVSQDRMHAARS